MWWDRRTIPRKLNSMSSGCHRKTVATQYHRKSDLGIWSTIDWCRRPTRYSQRNVHTCALIFFFLCFDFSVCCQNYMLPWSDRILPRIGSSSLVLLLEVREAAIHPLWKIQFAHSLCLMFCSVVLIFLFVTSHSRLHSLVAERHPMDTGLALKFVRPTSCPRRRRSGFC